MSDVVRGRSVNNNGRKTVLDYLLANMGGALVEFIIKLVKSLSPSARGLLFNQGVAAFYGKLNTVKFRFV